MDQNNVKKKNTQLEKLFLHQQPPERWFLPFVQGANKLWYSQKWTLQDWELTFKHNLFNIEQKRYNYLIEKHKNARLVQSGPYWLKTKMIDLNSRPVEWSLTAKTDEPSLALLHTDPTLEARPSLENSNHIEPEVLPMFYPSSKFLQNYHNLLPWHNITNQTYTIIAVLHQTSSPPSPPVCDIRKPHTP